MESVETERPPEREAQREGERLRTLRDYALLDTSPEGAFDGIVRLAAEILGSPIALFSLVDGDRIWFKARYGTGAEEVARDVSFCAYAAQHDEVLVVEDASADRRFSESGLVTHAPHVRFYAGAPVHARNGHVLGTLCVLDVAPRHLTADDLRVLEILAREVESQLELRQALAEQQRLYDERAVLTDLIVHDASGIVAALRWSFRLLEREHERIAEVLPRCQQHADELMRLCESVLQINEKQPRSLAARRSTVSLRPWFDRVGKRVGRLARAAGIGVELVNDLPEEAVQTDVELLERILMNLVSNALQACSQGATIEIAARTRAEGRELEFVVADDGPGVPKDLEQRIFEPYFSARKSGPSGAGLGLSLCRLAARALQGSIQYEAVEPRGARFRVVVPVSAR